MSPLKRSIMMLYSGTDPRSHQVRIVLAEKNVAVEVNQVDPNSPSEILAEVNPYQSLPTLIDRDLVLYEHNVIIEYLDERFPHPPLLPVYPVSRAKSRLMRYRIGRDWYSQMDAILYGNEQQAETARKLLGDSLTTVIPVFDDSPYFLSNEFTLVDCAIAPLLWRLPELDIKLPKNAKSIFQYMERIFTRPAFEASLTETEREIRE